LQTILRKAKEPVLTLSLLVGFQKPVVQLVWTLVQLVWTLNQGTKKQIKELGERTLNPKLPVLAGSFMITNHHSFETFQNFQK